VAAVQPTTITKEIAAALRARVLKLTAEDVGLPQESGTSQVFGLIVETAHPDAVASLVALADGSVSLYVSDGSGCVGCGAHRDVRQAGSELLRLAELTLSLSTFTNDVALPQEGVVRFYFLTRAGIRYVQTSLEEINKVDQRLSELYFAGQRLLAVIERVGAGQSLAQEIRLTLNEMENGALGNKEKRDCDKLGANECLSVGNVVRRLRP
jgi:hypothetical protein